MATVPIRVTLTVDLEDIDLNDLADEDGDITEGLIEYLAYSLSEVPSTEYTIDSLTVGGSTVSVPTPEEAS